MKIAVIGASGNAGSRITAELARRGHNVTALMLPDGRYAVVISETRPGTVFVSKSPDGPWEELGRITVADNPRWRASNESVLLRPDGVHFRDASARLLAAWLITQAQHHAVFSGVRVEGPEAREISIAPSQ